MKVLTKNKEFQRVYQGEKKAFGYYTLVFYKKNHYSFNRFGFVASKKTGNAVCRNRLKRLLREYIRTNITLDEKKAHYDIVLVSKRNFGLKYKDIKLKEVEKDLNKIIKKIGIKL